MRFDRGFANDRNRRILLVAARSGEGPLTEHITATQAQPAGTGLHAPNQTSAITPKISESTGNTGFLMPSGPCWRRVGGFLFGGAFKSAIAGSARHPGGVPAKGALTPPSRMKSVLGNSGRRNNRQRCRRSLGCDRLPRRHWCRNLGRNESGSQTLPTLIAPSVIPRPVSNKGSRPAPDFERLAPIRLRCPPTAKAFSDIAIVPGPPISSTQSTPRALVSSRTFSSQFGVSV